MSSQCCLGGSRANRKLSATSWTMVLVLGRRTPHLSEDGALLLTFPWNVNFTWKNDQPSGVVQMWLFGRYCLKNEQGETVTLKEATDHAAADGKICKLKWQFKFSKPCTCHCERGGFLILKSFSIEHGGILTNANFWYCMLRYVCI